MQLLLKDIEWMAWSVKHKKKRELQVSLPLNEGLHTFNKHSVREKNMNKKLVVHRAKFTLVQVYFLFTREW